jgi:hypothetical protein
VHCRELQLEQLQVLQAGTPLLLLCHCCRNVQQKLAAELQLHLWETLAVLLLLLLLLLAQPLKALLPKVAWQQLQLHCLLPCKRVACRAETVAAAAAMPDAAAHAAAAAELGRLLLLLLPRQQVTGGVPQLSLSACCP